MRISRVGPRAVGVYLEQRGVKSERIIVQYFGEEKPVADNNTKEGRQQNRRVEMTILFAFGRIRNSHDRTAKHRNRRIY